MKTVNVNVEERKMLPKNGKKLIMIFNLEQVLRVLCEMRARCRRTSVSRSPACALMLHVITSPLLANLFAHGMVYFTLSFC